jgi:hypothetical protein
MLPKDFQHEFTSEAGTNRLSDKGVLSREVQCIIRQQSFRQQVFFDNEVGNLTLQEINYL